MQKNREKKFEVNAPVVLERLGTPSGLTTDQFAVVLYPNDTELREQVGIVSERYQLIPNESAQSAAVEIMDKSGFEYQPETTIFDGKRLRQRWIFPEVGIEPRKGDIVQTGLDLINSYGGSTQFGLNFIARRLACENGMMVDFLLGGVRFRHYKSNGNGDWKEELDRTVEFLSALTKRQDIMVPAIQRMIGHKIERPFIQGCFQSLGIGNPLIGSVYQNIEEDSEWGLYNAFTRTLAQRESIANDNKNRIVSAWFFKPEDRRIPASTPVKVQ